MLPVFNPSDLGKHFFSVCLRQNIFFYFSPGKLFFSFLLGTTFFSLSASREVKLDAFNFVKNIHVWDGPWWNDIVQCCGQLVSQTITVRQQTDFIKYSTTAALGRVRGPIPNQVRGSNFPSCVQLPFDLFSWILGLRSMHIWFTINFGIPLLKSLENFFQ